MSRKDREKKGSDDEGARSFTRALEMVSEGRLVRDASNELHKLMSTLVADADNRGDTSKGALTLVLKLAVEPTGIVQIVYDVKTKEPAPPRPKGALWVTAGGNLTPHNPRQQSFDLRDVSGDGDAREIDDDMGAGKAREV